MNFIAHRRYTTQASLYPILILIAVLLIIAYVSGYWYGRADCGWKDRPAQKGSATSASACRSRSEGSRASKTVNLVSQPDYQKLASIIYKIEGSDQTRWAYGVKQIGSRKIRPHELTEQEARKITLTSLRNSRQRWELAGKPGEFIAYFQKRWCPDGKEGGEIWLKNMRALQNQTQEG